MGGQSDRPRQKKCTAKNKLVPRGQQNRLHLNEVTQKGEQKSCLEVNKIDFTKKAHCKKLINTSKSTKSTTPKKVTKKVNERVSRSSKSTSPRRTLQKINLPQGHRNRPHQCRHPQRGKNKIKKESLKIEGQKAIPYNHESKPP